MASTFRPLIISLDALGHSKPIPIAISILQTTHSLQSLQIRSKHSNTQVKRLFKNNPAVFRLQKKGKLPVSRANVEKIGKMASFDKNDDIESETSANPPLPKVHQAPTTPIYPPIFKPLFLEGGWSAPPPPEFEIPEYPFRVERTGKKPFNAVGFLPVYSDFRVHGTKQTTIIKNVKGDTSAFLSELRSVLGLPHQKKLLNDTYISSITPAASSKKSLLRNSSSREIVKNARHGGGEGGRGVTAENPVRIRAGGTIELHGNRVKEVRRWLAGLGF